MVRVNPGNNDGKVTNQAKLKNNVRLDLPKFRRWIRAGVTM